MASEPKLTEAQKEVIRTIEVYGSGIDFGGAKASRRLLKAARELSQRGIITDPRWASITDIGRIALDGAREGETR